MKYLLQSYNPWEDEWVTMREYDDLDDAEVSDIDGERKSESAYISDRGVRNG